MSEKSENSKLTRRSFLGASGAVASVAIVPETTGETSQPAKADVRSVSLKDTEHIRTYYALART